MIFWLWLVGYLWFWRYHLGFVYEEGAIDFTEYIFLGIAGSIACVFWPVTVSARLAYRVGRYYELGTRMGGAGFFPEPKQVESRSEKHERILREKDKEIKLMRASINSNERELGMPLTRWDN